MKEITGYVLVTLVICGLNFTAMAQSEENEIKISDRRAFLDEKTNVLPDARRTPWPPSGFGPKDSLAILGGRVFDGTGNPVETKDILIFNNKIEAVADVGTLNIPEGINVINLKGETVMPGLIDLHTHLSVGGPGVSLSNQLDEAAATLRAVEKMNFYLGSGITSIRDVASLKNVPFQLKEWVLTRRMFGPRIFPAGTLITAPGGHGAEDPNPHNWFTGTVTQASGPVEWRKAVRANFRKGADIIKVASHFSKDEIRAAVEEAHALGLQVTCDCETFYIEWAVEAGVDIIEHPLPRTDEVIEKMAEKNVAAVPTLIPYDYIFYLNGGYWGSTSRRFTFSQEDNLEMLKKLRQAGVKIGVGTDLVSNWFRSLPDPYISELKNYVKAGFTEEEALIAATRTSAEILDMDHVLGTLEKGKLADLIIIDGRPDEDLEDLKLLKMVIRDGEIVLLDGKILMPRLDRLDEPSPED